MSSNNDEVVVERIVLQQPMAHDSKEYPVSMTYNNEVHTATVTVSPGQTIPHNLSRGPSVSGNDSNGQKSDKFLSLQVTQSPLELVPFKLEIEDMDQNTVFSFMGHWQYKPMKKIINVSELKSQNPNLFVNNGTDLTLVISMGPRDQLNKPKVVTEIEKFVVIDEEKLMAYLRQSW